MSFYDDASLVFLPSGEAGKDGKAYSMKPTDGSGDFTFSRGSNLTATRVDSNGLIEKGRENLLLQSNQFNTTWSQSGTTRTSGQSGYDGSSDAWEIARDGAAGLAFIYQTISSTGVQTFSLYAKANTEDWIYLQDTATGGGGGYFDLANGTAGTTSGIDSSIDSVGGGWYRIQVVSNRTTSGNIRIFVASANANLSVTGSIYIQDAQVEQGLVATEYIESGATTGKAGLLEDSPRFDYSGGASCPSLLLEPSRTNLLEYSEYFEGSGWIAQDLNLDANSIISPEGIQNAYKIIPTATNGTHILNNSSSGTAVYSVFAKQGGYKRFRFNSGTSGNGFVSFDLNTGQVVSSGGTYYADSGIEDYGNGWYRCYLVLDGSTSNSMTIAVEDNSGNVSFAGDGTSGLYIYGAQCEANASYPTSYIPNHSGGSVTRNADDCGGAGTSSTFNDTEGVLFIDLKTTKNTSPAQITINDGTYGNRIIFEVRPDAAFIKALINSRGTNVYDVSVSASPSTAYKVAIKYSANDIAFFVNGVKETSTTTTTAMPTGLSDLSFTGKENDGALRFIGNVKQTLVFNTALSDNQCITLTS